MELAFALLCIVIGGLCWLVGNAAQQKRKREEELAIVSKFDEDRGRALQPLQTLYAQHPDIIPAVPRGVEALEFQGWFAEANKRLELWAITHRSQSEMALRIQLQKQINDLEEEHLRYGKTQSEILLIQHRHRAEIAKLDREATEAEDQVRQIKENAEKRNAPKETKSAAALPTQSVLERLAQTYQDEQRELKKYHDNPDMQREVKLHFDNERIRIKEGRR